MRNPTTAEFGSISQKFLFRSDRLFFSRRPHSYETTLKANRRITNFEPQNVEGWNRFAQSF
ncbi:hypothetical protein D1AOALGA4SA_12552 [Olavius algarvensis Delta 1 endosymbiont]|nr:hypothetical protein D1AOALGA4SA_12552 [Olavius algarvensis Delta 1 endosymbiont]